MKYLSILFLTTQLNLCYGNSVLSQNLVFAESQVELDLEQKNHICKLMSFMYDGQQIILYPVILNANSNTYQFGRQAEKQAKNISLYLQNLGFELLRMPKNFPSKYKGYSVSISAKFHRPKFLDHGEAPFGLAANFPKKRNQIFTINPLRDTTVFGEEGTEIHIPARALTSNETVQVKLREYYAISDLMIGELPTRSNGSMIETGGSIYLDAREARSKKSVKINPNIGLDIGFTDGKGDSTMQIFIKDKNTKQMNWVLPKPKVKTTWQRSWSMTQIVMDMEGNIIDSVRFDSEKEWLAYQRKEKAIQQKKEEIAKKKQENQDRLKVYDLGYINCDRFPDEPQAPFHVKADLENPAEYFIIFDGVRGVMNGYESYGKITFGRVPINKKGKLIAVSFQGEKTFYFERNIVPRDAQNTLITLKEVDKKLVDQKLASIR